MAKMNDDEFRSVIDEQVTQAASWSQSVMMADRERNLRHYHGMPMGNEVEGRSQVVSWDVFEVIETAMPTMIEPFFSGDEIGEFEPSKPEDEKYCEQATDYVNYLIKKKNPGFLTFSTWIKDGLLSKIGIVRSWWDATRVIKKENYSGLTEEQLVMLDQDENITILSQSSAPDPDDMAQRAQAMQALPTMPPEQAAQVQQMLSQPPKMLYDVEVQVDCGPKGVCIHNVPPELFVLTRRAKTRDECDIMGEQKHYTRSQLIEMGFKKDRVAALTDFDFSSIDGVLMTERDDDMPTHDDSTHDALTEISFFFGFVRVDYDGDGIAEWRRVLLAGNDILENEPVDENDEYHIWSPIQLPHRVIGMAMADPVTEIQSFKTALVRQYLDSLYLANNPRTYAVDGQVNLDDLLSSRIGGVVRIKTPGAVGPLQTSLVANESLQGIELANAMREERIGVTRNNQGLDGESLNKTAAGMSMQLSAGEKRMLMVLRVFAETGVKSLFKHVLKLICTYQDKPATVRMRNQWVNYDPRNWSHEMDVNINVGLGTGDKKENLLMLQNFGNFMMAAKQDGIIKPSNVYEFGKMLLKSAKIQGGEQKLLSEPEANPQPMPTPDMMKIQAEQQKAQAQMQADAQKHQLDMQFREREMQQTAQMRERELQLEAEKQQLQAQADMQERQHKAELDAQLEQQRMENDRLIAQMNNDTKVLIAQMAAQPAQQEGMQALQQMMAELQAVMKRAGAPKRIIRDPATNRAVGVETINEEDNG